MPTYTEALFEPLEAWLDGPLIPATERQSLRLIVARMLLEHAGRGSVHYFESGVTVETTANLVAELERRGVLGGKRATS